MKLYFNCESGEYEILIRHVIPIVHVWKRMCLVMPGQKLHCFFVFVFLSDGFTQ